MQGARTGLPSCSPAAWSLHAGPGKQASGWLLQELTTWAEPPRGPHGLPPSELLTREDLSVILGDSALRGAGGAAGSGGDVLSPSACGRGGRTGLTAPVSPGNILHTHRAWRTGREAAGRGSPLLGPGDRVPWSWLQMHIPGPRTRTEPL